MPSVQPMLFDSMTSIVGAVQQWQAPPMLLVRGYLNAAQQQALWQEAQEYPWQQPHIQVYGKAHAIPRRQVWFADPHCDYRYSGLMVRAIPWPKYGQRLREKLWRDWQFPCNGVLVNHYADGRDCMGWHSDDEAELQPGCDIASVTIGATRDFDLRHCHLPQKLRLTLHSGDLLLMRWPMQQYWQHAVPKRLRQHDARINYTFRQLIPGFHVPQALI